MNDTLLPCADVTKEQMTLKDLVMRIRKEQKLSEPEAIEYIKQRTPHHKKHLISTTRNLEEE